MKVSERINDHVEDALKYRNVAPTKIKVSYDNYFNLLAEEGIGSKLVMKPVKTFYLGIPIEVDADLPDSKIIVE